MHLLKLSGRLSSAAFLLLAVAVPASAADPAATVPGEAIAVGAPAQAAKPAEPQPRKICRTIESSSNRLGAKRICMTKEEWSHVKFD